MEKLTILAATLTTRALMRTTRTLIALITCALPISAWAGDVDVSRVELDKIRDRVQTSTADPVDGAVPFCAGTFVGDSSPTSTHITSAAFTPPGGSSINLSGDGEGNFDFEACFATKAAMDAAFPNGTYNFTIQTITTPATYSPALTLTGDGYPITPKLSNSDWSGGELQIDASADYTFNWNSPPSGVGFFIALGTEDNKKIDVGGPITSYTVPAGTLLPNQGYLAGIGFRGTDSSFQDGPTSLGAGYNGITHFDIHTFPSVPLLGRIGHGLLAAALVGVIALYGRRERVVSAPS